MADEVNHPAHYALGIQDSDGAEVEVIDVIEAAISDVRDPVLAYQVSNALKYLLRFPHKGGVTDLRKAKWYLDRALGQGSAASHSKPTPPMHHVALEMADKAIKPSVGFEPWEAAP
jgi:hypothetical protein